MSADIAPSGDDDNISDFSEAKYRHILTEANRLANLPPGGWRLQIDDSAKRLHIQSDILERLIDDIVADKEKKAKEKAAADRLSSQLAARARKEEAKEKKADARRAKREMTRAEAEKEKRDTKEAKAKAALKAKAFATIQCLPVADRDIRLQKLAEQLGEDISDIRDEFTEFLDSVTASSSVWDVEPWPEPVPAAELLQDLTAKIQKHIVLAPHQAVAVALWCMLTWVHEVAARHSPYLVATSADAGEGKTTLIINVVGRLTPKPFLGGSPTPAIVYRTADASKPTMLFDNVDGLFQRKPDLVDIFLLGHLRGVKIPRAERSGGGWVTRWFDPFTPKAVTLIGTDIPQPLHTRCLLVKLKKAKATDVVTKPTDDEEFATLCRKLKRWSDDNGAALTNAPPSPDFINREADNWTLQFAIAQTAGGEWPARALESATLLTRTMYQPSWRQLLLGEFQDAFARREYRKAILSKDFFEWITSDPLSIWREYNHGTGVITQRQIAHLLKGIEIFPRLIGAKRDSGYCATDFVDAFERYIPTRVAGGDRLIVSAPKRKTRKITPAAPKRKTQKVTPAVSALTPRKKWRR
jgi:hypothetical protein